MSDIFKLRLDGYRAYHSYGIMPVGGIDFFSNQLVLYHYAGGKRRAVATYRSITLSHCDKASFPFPVIEHNFRGCETEYPLHLEAIETWTRRQRAHGEVAYNSGWTMAPDMEPALRNRVRAIAKASYYHYYTSYTIPNIITATAVPFKMARVHVEMGFDFLRHEGNELPDFAAAPFGGERYHIMTLSNGTFTDEYGRESEPIRDLWEQRITFREGSLVHDIDSEPRPV